MQSAAEDHVGHISEPILATLKDPGNNDLVFTGGIASRAT